MEEVDRQREGPRDLGAVLVLVDEVVDVPGDDVARLQRVHVGRHGAQGGDGHGLLLLTRPLPGSRLLAAGEGCGAVALFHTATLVWYTKGRR